MNRERIWPIVRRVWIGAGVSATVIFIAWSLLAYRASAEAKSAWAERSVVRVQSGGEGIWHIEPDSSISDVHFVFFPGALVDPRAYAPLLRNVASAGFRVTLVELPRRGSFGGAESAELYDRIGTVFASGRHRFVVAGHSRGGVVASQVASDMRGDIAGLVLIGTSHPRDVDLSSIAVPVTKIVGTRDGLASPDEVNANAALLPGHTRWVWVDGGNHSQFGWYGFQPMDRRPQIEASAQRQIMTGAVIDLLRSIAPVQPQPVADMTR